MNILDNAAHENVTARSLQCLKTVHFYGDLGLQPTRIPTRADDPPHMLLWSADEILPIVGGLGIGIVLDQVIVCVAIGAVTTNLYKRFRDLHPDGFLMHIAYHYGFGFTRSASMINPFIKTLIP